MIAQDVAVTMPELTRVNDAGDLTVNYDGLEGPLLEALKDLRRQNAALHEELEQLEQQDSGGER